MKKLILYPLIIVLMLIVSTSLCVSAQHQTPQLYVTGTVSSNENMLVTVSGTKKIESNIVVAELNDKKIEMLTNKKGRALLNFSAIAADLAAPGVAVIKSFDKNGKLLSTAKTTVHPGISQNAAYPVMENLPANLSNGEAISIKGRNLGADAKLFCGNQLQETLSASDREMIIFTNSKIGQQSMYVSTANGVSKSQSVNIYSLDFNLAKNSISPQEIVQAMLVYESIPVGTKLIFTNRSPGTIKMNIPDASNTGNKSIYIVAAKNGTMPINITGETKGEFTIALDLNFRNEPVISDTDPNGILTFKADDEEITKRDDLPILIRPGYDKYLAARAINNKSHEDAMKDAFVSEDERKKWAEDFKRIYKNEKK